MSWIFLAVSAHFFWALVNIGDKYVVNNRIKSPYVYLVFLTIVGALSVVLIPFVDFVVPSFDVLLWLFFVGALYFYGGMPYMKAVQIEEVSRVNIWWNLIPFFSLIIGWFTIQEKLNGMQLLSLLVLITGAFVASIHAGKKTFVFSKTLLLMIIACLFYSGYAIIFRYVTQIIPFISAFIWLSIFMLLFSLTLFLSKKFRKDFVSDFKRLDKKLITITFSISIFDRLGIFLNIWALSLGPAALVFAFEGSQVLFVFTIATLISIFAPRILKEELDKKNIILKICSMILMMIGVVILAFN